MTIDNAFSSDINVKEIFKQSLRSVQQKTIEQSRSVQQKTKGQNSANQVLIEIEQSDYLQRPIDFVIKYCLKNFTLVLQMDS